MYSDSGVPGSPGSIVRPHGSWTVLSLLEWSAGYLKEHSFDEARLNVELLLAHVLGLSRIELYLRFDRPVDSDELARFKALFQRRLRHEPLQYILGETEFMGLRLYVDRSVLIPRPETETLVEKVLESIRASGRERVEILDIGTGSGNIPVALAHFSGKVAVTGIDVSPEALRTASRNVARHKLSNITLIEADVFSDIVPGKKFDIIVSNPPYVSRMDHETLAPEIRDFEPANATCDGDDGYRVIGRVCQIAGMKLEGGGELFMEVGYGQADRAKMLAEAAGLTDILLFNDYAHVPRVLTSRRPKGGRKAT